MTLILTALPPHMVVQLSDRLVTRSGKSVDPVANKTIVFRAKDAIFSLSYTGIAEMRGRPTDAWLVEAMIGKDLDYGRPGKFAAAIQSGKIAPHWPDVGQAVARIADRIRYDLCQSRWRAQLFEVAIAGWQLQRRKPYYRPILIDISKSAGSTDVQVNRYARYWHFRRAPEPRTHNLPPVVACAHPEVNFPTTHFPGFCRRINEAVLLYNDMQDYATRLRSALVDTLEDVREANPRIRSYVGPHCMTVTLPRPSLGKGTVTFVPRTVHRGVVQTASDAIPVNLVFSPFLVSEYAMAAPSLMTSGGLSVNLGGYEIELGPSPDEDGDSFFWAMSSQPRPRLT